MLPAAGSAESTEFAATSDTSNRPVPDDDTVFDIFGSDRCIDYLAEHDAGHPVSGPGRQALLQEFNR